MLRLVLIAGFLSVAAVPAGAAAPDCWDYASGGWDPAGSIPGPDPLRAVALTADGRLVGGFRQGVAIYSLADPAGPVFSGFLPTDAPVTHLAAAGDRILALTEAGTLWYGLLTAGLAPAWGDSIAVQDEVDRIALDGHTAALVLGQQALLAVDVSDPKHLEFGGFALPSVQINDLVLDRGLAYLGTGLDRFYVYDVSDPHDVRFVGSPRDGLASCQAIAVRYPVVYAAISGSVYIYDVSDPAAPVRIGRGDQIATSVQHLHAGKDHVFALTDTEQAVMYRVAAPDRLDLLGHAALPAAGIDLVSLGDHLYTAVAEQGGLVLDAGQARHPGFDRQLLEWRIEASDFRGARAYAITTDGLNSRRLEVLEHGPAGQLLTTVGTLPTIGAAVALVAAEPLVVFATSLTDLTMVDVSNPAAPHYLAITSTQTFPRGLLLIGDAAYLANNSQGLVGYDLSDPSRPRGVGLVPIPRTQVAWSSVGSYALVGATGGLNGVYVVDCHRPDQMRVAAWVSLATPVVDVLGAGNHAYVADDQGRVHVFDLADPNDPRPRGALTVGEGRGRLGAYGRHVFYVDSKQGVVALDAIAPDTPQLVGRSLVPLDWATVQVRATGLYLPQNNAVSRLPLPCDALAAVPRPAAVAAGLAAAPNPFNPRTNLHFRLEAAAPVALTIH
ncbi:MAG: hypothetical protein IH621_05335, partial [Krumholzibacteria bacterium]|nr:hypothetical protein [Candidatus Krumholzibacteria bacterium]